MEAWESVRTLRAVRAFADRPIEPEHLGWILHAGRRAPSSKNRQRRDFIVVRDRERLRALSETGAYAGHVAQAAAAIGLVTPEAEDLGDVRSIALDLGQSVQNMMLTAWSLGIGSVHATVRDDPRVRELLGYPESYRCDFLISLGYPVDPSLVEEPPRPGGRRPLEDVVHEERW